MGRRGGPPPPPRHLVASPREWCLPGWWLLRKEAPRPPSDHPMPAAIGPRSKWIFCNCPLQISQEEKSPSTHLYTEKLYTAQISETGVLQMAGVSKCKRKWKLCRREKKKKGILVINVVLDMLRGESYLLKENQRENIGVREHNGNSLLGGKKIHFRYLNQSCPKWNTVWATHLILKLQVKRDR